MATHTHTHTHLQFSFPDEVAEPMGATTHVDMSNCSEKGFTYQIVINTIVYLADGTIVRALVAAYGRECMKSYAWRKETVEKLARMCQKFLQDKERVPLGFEDITPATFRIPKRQTKKHPDIYLARVNLNKSVKASFEVAVYERVLAHPQAKKYLSFDRLIELGLAVGWLASNELFGKITLAMLEDSNSCFYQGGCFVLEFLDILFEEGGCAGGEEMRHIPHFNKDIAKELVYKSLLHLRTEVIRLIQLKDFPTNSKGTANFKRVRQEFEQAMAYLKKNVYGHGELTGQHSLQFFLHADVIPHPALAQHAILNPNCNSYTKLEEIDCDLSNLSSEQRGNFLRDVTSKLCELMKTEKTLAQVEHCICEMPKKTTRQVEPHLNGQSFIAPKLLGLVSGRFGAYKRTNGRIAIWGNLPEWLCKFYCIGTMRQQGLTKRAANFQITEGKEYLVSTILIFSS